MNKQNFPDSFYEFNDPTERQEKDTKKEKNSSKR